MLAHRGRVLQTSTRGLPQGATMLTAAMLKETMILRLSGKRTNFHKYKLTDF